MTFYKLRQKKNGWVTCYCSVISHKEDQKSQRSKEENNNVDLGICKSLLFFLFYFQRICMAISKCLGLIKLAPRTKRHGSFRHFLCVNRFIFIFLLSYLTLFLKIVMPTNDSLALIYHINCS